jgi:nitrile hydratase
MTGTAFDRVRSALHETPAFAVGDRVTVATRAPIGHYRVPIYLRGNGGRVMRIVEPALIDNEEEGFGRNAGGRRHYYRVAFAMPALWPDYAGSPEDELHVEIFETWLEPRL